MMSSDIQKTVHHANGILDSGWRLWEQYITTGAKNRGNYSDNMGCLANIKNLTDFAYVMKKTSYNSPSKFFDDTVMNISKK